MVNKFEISILNKSAHHVATRFSAGTIAAKNLSAWVESLQPGFLSEPDQNFLNLVERDAL